MRFAVGQVTAQTENESGDRSIERGGRTNREELGGCF